jgi:hypothetical protein
LEEVMPLGDMKVHLIKEKDGLSRIEPRWDPEWSELTKLKYLAEVERVRNGVEITVRLGQSWTNGVANLNVYSLSVPGVGMSPMDYRTCADYIRGIGMGYASARMEERKRLFDLVHKGVEGD